VQHHRDAAFAQQSPVVRVQIVRDEHPARPSQFLERGDGGGIAATDGVDGLHTGMPLKRLEHQPLIGRVDTVAVADLHNRAARAAQRRSEADLALPLATKRRTGQRDQHI
jgi:hypothetical protein